MRQETISAGAEPPLAEASGLGGTGMEPRTEPGTDSGAGSGIVLGAAVACPLPERLVYVSRAAPGLDHDTLYAIIRAAHARNAAAGVSGALIHLDGCFVQLLEGPAEAVAATFARVARDPRHSGITLRSRERALAPLFRGQAMALRSRACLDPALLEAFAYRPGFPVESFPADVLVEFLVSACHRAAPAPN